MLCLGAALLATLSIRLGIPTLVAFLVLGMLLGSDGPVGIAFDDPTLARQIAIVCLVAILWEGGIGSRCSQIRPVVGPAISLATIGVGLTALVTGLAAGPLFGLEALLGGAVVGSTDAAAVFAILRFVSVRTRIKRLLEAESGFNDPMAIALALGLIGWISAEAEGVGPMLLILVRELGVGPMVALVVGVGVRFVVPRMRPLFAAYAPLASVGLACQSFGLADVLGGSGYLAVDVFGSLDLPAMGAMRSFHQGVAFAAELGLFLMLGPLVFPAELPSVALPGLALAAVLVLIARPVAVAASTLGMGSGAASASSSPARGCAAGSRSCSSRSF